MFNPPVLLIRCVVLAIPLLAIASASVHADGVAIVGGLTYDTTSGSGYANPVLPAFPGSTAGRGVAVGYVSKTSNQTSLGPRGMRWESNGIAAELMPLGTRIDGYGLSRALAVNVNGTVVGHSESWGITPISTGWRAVRWDVGSLVPVELGHLGARADGQAAAGANAINSEGTIVGWSIRYTSSTNFGERAVRWNAGTTIATELGHLGTDVNGITMSRALAVNSSGASIGYTRRYDGINLLGNVAVRWNSNTTVATELLGLGTGPGGAVSTGAIAINDAGTIAGTARKWLGNVDIGGRAVRWESNSAVAIELGHIGTNSSGYTESEAYDVNSVGTLIGSALKWSGNTNLGRRAVRWGAGETAAIELGNLGVSTSGKTNTSVSAINDIGTVVGFAEVYDSFGTFINGSAVAWQADGTAIDLNTLLAPASGWTRLTHASGIDSTGWVTGIGQFDPDATGSAPAYQRAYSMLVPAAGTYGRGDANFDTHVNFDDLLILAQHYGDSNTTHAVDLGDLDLNGVVDFDDLLALAQHYESGAAVDRSPLLSTFSSDWVLARSMVPEPMTCVGLAILGVRSRRRRR